MKIELRIIADMEIDIMELWDSDQTLKEFVMDNLDLGDDANDIEISEA
jgi:hypothetical protein